MRKAERTKALYAGSFDPITRGHLDIIGKAYTNTPLQPEKNGTYVGRVSKPEKGYTAFFVELVFANGGPAPYKFTTQVSVVPDVLPHRIEELQRTPKQ